MSREKDRQKFIDLANKRVNSAIKTIKLIGNLSNKSNYSYTENDVKMIFSALQKELKQAKDKFSSEEESSTDVFKLEKQLTDSC